MGPPTRVLDDDGTWREVPRHEGRGQLVCRFLVPLALAAPINRTSGKGAWRAKLRKTELFDWIAPQVRQWRTSRDPLPGRPQFIAIRFSSNEPDSTASWWKEAGDRLLPPRFRRGQLIPGLAVIRDDKPKSLDVQATWERAPKGEGFCLFEVWTG